MATTDTAVAPPPKVGLRAPFGGRVTRGVAMTWLSLIVLIPLAAVVLRLSTAGLRRSGTRSPTPEAVRRSS